MYISHINSDSIKLKSRLSMSQIPNKHLRGRNININPNVKKTLTNSEYFFPQKQRRKEETAPACQLVFFN